jgi:hypothetical protein
MKPLLVCLLILVPCALTAQSQQPFVFTAYGGLFFPSNPGFKDAYRSSSDLIYGGGIGLPLSSTLFLTGDYAWFKPEALLGPSGDSSLSLNEKILHVGLLAKQPLTRTLFLRFSGGFNLIWAAQSVASASKPAVTSEADRRLGYFGGFGVEQLTGDPHVSFFADLLYDYRRSRSKELYGDIGGMRVVFGAHLFLF